MRKILEACPTCGGPLAITAVRCERCATEVHSRYEPCPFCRLTPEQMNFMVLFVQTRGNLTDVEKALGVSYPTIRGKLDEVIRVVTSAASPPAPAPPPMPASPPSPSHSPAVDARRMNILSQIAAGKLSAADGLSALRADRGGTEKEAKE